MPTAILGTAQWGSAYGITNRVGKIPDEEIEKIASLARDMGIRTLDTAAAYGDAESRIATLAFDFGVQTKLSVARRTRADLAAQFQASAVALQPCQIESVLIHDWHEADSGSRRAGLAFLSALVDEGSIRGAGVSVYTHQDLEAIVETGIRIATIQVPVNVLDQRLEGSAIIHDLRSSGVVVQARSVFLQGILADPEAAGMMASHPDIVRFFESHDKDLVRARTTALAFVRSRDWIDQVVLAVCSAVELTELESAWNQPETHQDWERFASSDLNLIDPRTWSQAKRSHS